MNYWKRMAKESIRLYFLPLIGAYRAMRDELANLDPKRRPALCEKCGAPIKVGRH